MSEFDQELANDEGFQKFLSEQKESESPPTEVVEESVEEVVEVVEEAIEEKTETKSEVDVLAEKTGVSPDVAEEALRSGYKFDEYDQSDPRWKSPNEWIRTGELIDKYRRVVKSLDTKNEVINKMLDKFSKKEEIAYQRAIKDLETRRREAVEVGDSEAFDLVDAELRQQQKELEEFKTLDAQDPSMDYAEQEKAAAADFATRNAAWFNNETFENSQMAKYAAELDEYLCEKGEITDVDERHKKVELEVRKKFSDSPVFKNVNRDKSPKVGVSEQKIGGTSDTTLTKEQEVFYREIKQANPKYTRAQFVKDME